MPTAELELKGVVMEPSDESLVLACRRSDEDGWQRLINRYQRLIYAIPRRAGLNADLSAEVFQQVFAILLENLHRIEQPAQIQAWLVTTARRETWRLIRRDKAYRPFAGNEDEDEQKSLEVADDTPLVDEVMLALEEQHKVRAAVAGIDERCRHLLTVLFYQDDPPPYAEIASSLGISEGSIGPTRARCLQKLLRVLNNSD